MNEAQAKQLRNLITEVKEAQVRAFGANANQATYEAWITTADKVEAYIKEITVAEPTYQIERVLVPIESIDIQHIANVSKMHENGTLSGDLSPVVLAARALQKAVSYQHNQLATPRDSTAAEKAIAKTLSAIDYTRKTGSLGWAVKRSEFPTQSEVGSAIRINYLHGGPAAVIAEVHSATDYPDGRALVLRLLETCNGFGLSSVGWSYIGFWMPKHPGASGGFTYRTAKKVEFISEELVNTLPA